MAGKFSIETIFKATDRMSGTMSRLSAGVGKFAGGVRSQLAKIDALGEKALSSAKQAAIALGAAGVVAGTSLTAAAQPGLDFGEAIASVGAVSLMTRDQIADLEAEARKLGLTTKFSATEVAKGMEVMGRAGFTNAEVIAGIAPMLSAAAAEGAEFEPVAEVVSSVIKGMQLSMSDTARVADVLTLASAKTKSSILSLGESLATAGPMAKQFNIPLEQVTASVALLQDVGLDASVAGSAVGTMLNNLANPSKEARTEMAALGISFQDAAGNMLPLEQVFQQFADGSKKAGGNMKQVAFFADLLGLRGQKAGQNLRDAFTSGKFTELVESLKNAEGSAAKMAAIRLDQTKGDFTKLKNAALELGITLFDLYSDDLRGVTQGVTDWVKANQGLIAQDVVGAVNKATFAVGLFTDGVKTGFATTKSAVEAVLAPLGSFGGILDHFPAWTTSVNFFGQAVGGLVPVFVGALVLSRGLSLALFGLEVVTKGVTGAVWLANVAYRAYAAATVLWTLATQQGIGAALSLLATTKLGTVAMWIARGARAAWTAVTGLATAAETLFTGKIVASTVATDAAATSMVAAEASTAALAATLGAATLAVVGLVAAWKSWESLQKASGGHGWEAIKGLFNAKGVFGSVDQALNDEARKKFAQEHNLDVTGQSVEDYIKEHANDEPGAPAPTVSTAAPSAQGAEADAALKEAMTAAAEATKKLAESDRNGVIKIELPEGVTGTVTKQPSAGGKLDLSRSGAVR